MADFDKTCHLELPPKVDILFSGRRRVTRRFELGKNSNIDDVIYRAYGDADPAEVTACTLGYDNLRLIQQGVEPRSDPRAASVLVQVFETLTGAWVAETGPKDETGENGLLRRTLVFVALPNTSADAYAVGTYADGGLTLAQKLLEKTDAMWRLTLVLGDAGTLSRTTSSSNNGKLSTITIESANEVPETPSGYVLVSTQVVGEDGFETNRYTFVKGIGEISRETSLGNNGKLEQVSIRHLTAPDGTDPLTALSGYVRVSNGKAEAEGHLVWTAQFVKGTGEISRETSLGNNGKLEQVSIRHLTAPDGTDPLTALSGYVRVSNGKAEAEGHLVWTATFAKGLGLVQASETDGPVAGTRRISHVSLGPAPITDATASLPDGVLIEKSDNEENGFVRYVRTCVAGTIVGVKQTYKDVVDVAVPGTVTLTTQVVSAGDLSGTLAIEQVVPPTTKSVAATVTVEIVTTPPNTVTVAYNLGEISCSVLSTQASYDYAGFDRISTVGGGVTLTAERRSANIGASIRFYPRCYLIGTSASGSFTYTAGSQLDRSSGGSIVTGTPKTSTETNTLTGTGATSAVGYVTTGVVQRRSREVFNSLAGVTYFEVITWSV